MQIVMDAASQRHVLPAGLFYTSASLLARRARGCRPGVLSTSRMSVDSSLTRALVAGYAYPVLSTGGVRHLFSGFAQHRQLQVLEKEASASPGDAAKQAEYLKKLNTQDPEAGATGDCMHALQVRVCVSARDCALRPLFSLQWFGAWIRGSTPSIRTGWSSTLRPWCFSASLTAMTSRCVPCLCCSSWHSVSACSHRSAATRSSIARALRVRLPLPCTAHQSHRRVIRPSRRAALHVRDFVCRGRRQRGGQNGVQRVAWGPLHARGICRKRERKREDGVGRVKQEPTAHLHGGSVDKGSGLEDGADADDGVPAAAGDHDNNGRARTLALLHRSALGHAGSREHKVLQGLCVLHAMAAAMCCAVRVVCAG
jgi:hypothetical protein